MNISIEIKNLNRLLRSRYVFLHVPKCAGSAIKRNIASSPHSLMFSLKHHDYSVRSLNLLDRRKKRFMAVRHPLNWYYSLYKYKMCTPSSKVRKGKDYPTMENNSFEDFFHDVVLRKGGFSSFSKWFKPMDPYYKEMFACAECGVGWCTAMLAWYGQQKLMCESIAEMSSQEFRDGLKIDSILRIEHLQKDFDNMVRMDGISIDMSPKYNKINFDVGPNRKESIRPVMDNYSMEMKELVYSMDSKIIEVFGYD